VIGFGTTFKPSDVKDNNICVDAGASYNDIILNNNFLAHIACIPLQNATGQFLLKFLA